MADVDDVAAALIEGLGGQVDTWKLQKLVYYCQAWNLVWEDEPLFSDPSKRGLVVRSSVLSTTSTGATSALRRGNGEILRVSVERNGGP